MNKEALRSAVLASIEAELSRQTRAAIDAREESISEESRAENKYDTHAQEAAYLAEAQARLAKELSAALEAWRALLFPAAIHERVQLGSLVTLATGSRQEWMLLGPSNGGLTVTENEKEVTVITPGSPIGRSLLGQALGATLPPAHKGAPARRVAALA